MRFTKSTEACTRSISVWARKLEEAPAGVATCLDAESGVSPIDHPHRLVQPNVDLFGHRPWQRVVAALDLAVRLAPRKLDVQLLRIGDAKRPFKALFKSPRSLAGANTQSLMVYVDDADASFDRALKAGATVKYPLEDAFWGDRYGKVADPFGHEWGIATHVKDLTDAELKRAADEWMAKTSQQMAAAQA